MLIRGFFREDAADLEVASSCEGLAAPVEPTDKRLDFTVHSHMGCEVTALREAGTARVTHVRTNAGVKAHVRLHIARLGEEAPTSFPGTRLFMHR